MTYQGREYPSISALLRTWTGEDGKAFGRVKALYQKGYTFDAIRAALKMKPGELQGIMSSICNAGRSPWHHRRLDGHSDD